MYVCVYASLYLFIPIDEDFLFVYLFIYHHQMPFIGGMKKESLVYLTYREANDFCILYGVDYRESEIKVKISFIEEVSLNKMAT